jgi:acyl-CoA reductase-like NAD-dependent aldehyde dehydrogenase
VQRYENIDDAFALANDSRYGLQAGIFTPNINTALDAARTLDFGGVVVNEVPTWRADQMPYGGNKDSGLGREGIRWAIDSMTEPRLLVIRTPS